jgi:BTB/POZ domain/BTB And C-terminal Kelch
LPIHNLSFLFVFCCSVLCTLRQPTGQQHQTLIIEEFEPDVFRQLIEYIHTGQVCLQPRTLLGVMNASDYYGLEELRRSCSGFVQCCITVDTVCALLSSAERYIQYKCTKNLVQKVLEFVDEHGNEVLNLGSFTLLPQHVVRLILARDELQADEFTKFQAALMWSKKYCDTNPVRFTMQNVNHKIFPKLINFRSLSNIK